MAKIERITEGWPSDFTHVRISTAKQTPGKPLAYKHILLGWLRPSEAYIVKIIAENVKDVIDWGYQYNFKIMDMMTPAGGAIAGAVTTIGEIAFFTELHNYARDQSRKNNTSIELEMAKLLTIMALPFGMLYLVGIVIYKLTQEDWLKILTEWSGFEIIFRTLETGKSGWLSLFGEIKERREEIYPTDITKSY